MTDWVVENHHWIESFHIIAVIAWMAGLLYLPRLFVYHCDAAPGGELSETLKIMERRLLRAIMTPAMIIVWVLGVTMAVELDLLDFSQIWFVVKLLAVVGLTGIHFFLMSCQMAFAEDENRRSSRFYRIINEVPTLLMIAIVILVVVKPG